MNVVKPQFDILTAIDGVKILKSIEEVGRTCYKSEDKITDDSCYKFASNLLKRGHEAVIEHWDSKTVILIPDELKKDWPND